MLLAGPTKELLDREEVNLEQREGIALKGKREAVQVYAVAGN